MNESRKTTKERERKTLSIIVFSIFVAILVAGVFLFRKKPITKTAFDEERAQLKLVEAKVKESGYIQSDDEFQRAIYDLYIELPKARGEAFVNSLDHDFWELVTLGRVFQREEMSHEATIEISVKSPSIEEFEKVVLSELISEEQALSPSSERIKSGGRYFPESLKWLYQDVDERGHLTIIEEGGWFQFRLDPKTLKGALWFEFRD